MAEKILANRTKAAPSLVPADIGSLSDDECVERLAHVIAIEDSNDLGEVARLIGRLAVTIE
jgi:hypothetical protein